MDIDEVRLLVRSGIYEVSLHAQQERLAEDLDIADIETAIFSGEIIEDYPTDPRGPSCLVSGRTGSRPVHVVLGWAHRKTGVKPILRVITVYIPKPPKWKDNQTRGDKK